MDEALIPDLAELRRRTASLQANMAASGLHAALLVQEIDRYYISGTLQSGYVLVPATGDPVIMVRKSAERAAVESPLPVLLLESLRKLPDMVRGALGSSPETLGVEMDVLPMVHYQRIQAMFPGVELKDLSQAMALTRAVKSPWEIDKIQKAAYMVAEAVREVPVYLKAGMSEVELAARVEYEMRTRGHGGFTPMRAFNQRLHYGHVFAGATAAEAGGYDMPTVGMGLSPAVGQGPSKRRIERGEPVVVDLVGHYAGYLADQTRIFSVGPLEAEYLEAFEASKEIEKAVALAAIPGNNAADLYEIAVKTAAGTGFAKHFMGEEFKVGFVGHGIGLEVDEYPFLAKGFDLSLKEGMVFALEPKFTFKGRAAVGIEDTYVVEPGGGRRLTVSEQKVVVVD